LISDHEKATMAQEQQQKSNCCSNFCKMWNYRKIVSQVEQYDYNMAKIAHWKL